MSQSCMPQRADHGFVYDESSSERESFDFIRASLSGRSRESAALLIAKSKVCGLQASLVRQERDLSTRPNSPREGFGVVVCERDRWRFSARIRRILIFRRFSLRPAIIGR